MFKPDGVHGDINVALWPLQVRQKYETEFLFNLFKWG